MLNGELRGGPYDVDAALVRSRLEGGERFVEMDEEDGKPSKSRFTVQARYKGASLCEVEIFSAENWWKRDGGEVLDTCIARHRSAV